MSSLVEPRSLLCVDPGKNTCGVALFVNETFQVGALLSAESTFDLACVIEEWWYTQRVRFCLSKCDVLIVEGQQVYGGLGHANPNDLLPLAYLAGAVFARIQATNKQMPLPRQWKGSLKKEIFTRRILSGLRKEELITLDEVACPKAKLHNVVDAIGLGLWFLRAVRTDDPPEVV